MILSGCSSDSPAVVVSVSDARSATGPQLAPAIRCEPSLLKPNISFKY